ncbi:hypothetical protein CAEBREN_32758 [Caenorhabditis brenneri]|uniref:Uncharacterized protein n=1 Tax=Caenorhabditis brenneri TaxID=135651 RepID=G0MCD2_CAEBE|nr:hypothetical protein CAEBREN_32758 [Caenorhabditis brenneri]
MADFDEYFYQSITTTLEQKSSLDEIQMSRKQRYYQRLNRPKPPPEDAITKKRKKLWVKDDSDDEMPKATPKIKRPRKKAAPKENVVEVIVLDGDTETSSSSFTPPVTSKPAPEVTKKLEMEKKDPLVDDDEGKAPEPAIQIEDEEPPKMTPHELRLRGRLPTWYHERQAHRAALLQKNLERKEIRLKMEKEMAEKQAEEDKKEERRKRDRERKREKTILKKIGDEGGTSGKGRKDLKAMVRENNQNLDEKLERKREKQEKHMITDPSLDPSLISLGAPEIVPWAPKRPPQPPKKTSPDPSLPSTSSSSESEDLQPLEEEDVPMELVENSGVQNLDDNLFDPVDFADMVIDSPTVRRGF